MSRETESALTPEEWRQRRYTPPNHFAPVLCASDDGLAVDNSGGECGWETVDARKAMALANLSLTLEKKEGAITQADVDVCTSAAWYFRKMARDSEAKRDNGQDSTSAYEHEQALIGAGKLATALAAKLRALVPPE